MVSRRGGGLALVAASLFLAVWASAEKADPQLRLVKKSSTERRHRLSRHLAVDAKAATPTVDLFIRVVPGVKLSQLAASYPRARFRSQAGNVITARVPISLLPALEADARVRRLHSGQRGRPQLNVVRSNSVTSGYYLGVLQNNNDLAAIDGSGVIVGVVDFTGIDWRHPDFIAAGNNSRILNIWDQTDNVGPSPTGYYGTQWTQAQLTDNLQFGSPAIRVTDAVTEGPPGHGSYVTGIAAGNGSGTNGNEPAGTYAGLARGADIIFVKALPFDTAVMDAIQYIVGRAAALGQRAVINLSLSFSLGPHDGTSDLDDYVGTIAADTPVAVSAGNHNLDAPHTSFTVGAGATVVSQVNATTPSGASSTEYIDADYWYPGTDDYNVTVTLNGGPGGSVSTTAGVDKSQTVGSGANTAAVYISYYDNGSGPVPDKELYVFVDVAATATMPTSISCSLTRSLNGGSGRVDGYTNTFEHTSFANNIASNGTLLSPATANNVFTVGAYNSKKTWTDVNNDSWTFPSLTRGAIADFSGLGPTRDGRLKPEITAPGAWIGSTYSSIQSPVESATSVLYDAKHKIAQGTSAAAPVVAGFLALKLQVSPSLTVSDLRSSIPQWSRQDGQTSDTPNNQWGYGKLMVSLKPAAAITGLAGQVLGASSGRFTWNASREATSYNVYYASNTSSLAGTTTSTTFDLTGAPANTVTGVVIAPANLAGEGPNAPNVTVTTLANPVTGSAVFPHASSVTVTYTPCLAAPTEQSCSGYRLEAWTGAGYSGTLFFTATADRSLGQLQVTGLSSETNYYLRLASLNSAGALNYTALGQVATTSSLLMPGAAGFSSVATTSLRASWTKAGNPTGTTYSADVSADPNFGGTPQNQQGSDLLSALFTGLTPNTSYYVRARAQPNGAYLVQGPQPTLAAAPAPAAAAFSALAPSALTLNWDAASNPGDTSYLAQISAASDFSSGILSSTTLNAFAVFGSLATNTTYYARVRAVNRALIATTFLSVGSTSTLALPLTSLPLSNLTAQGFTGHFGSGGNLGGTRYIAVASTMATLSPAEASLITADTFAVFSGLSANTQYFFSAAALNNNGGATAFFAALSTFTLPAASAVAVPTGTNETTSALRANWGANGNFSGTQFAAQISPDPAFGSSVLSSTTANAYADFTGLATNTLYYMRVRTLSRSANPDSGLTTATASTLSNPPSAAAQTYLYVGESSATVQWTPLPAAPPTAAAEGYVAQASTDSLFNGTLFSATVSGGLSSRASVAGLAPSTLYYVRVGALNYDGNPNFTAGLGSAQTLDRLLVSGTVASGDLTLTGVSRLPQVQTVSLRVPGGAFPSGTGVSLNPSVETALPPAVFNAGRGVPLSDGLGFELDAGGLQPVTPVTITMTFDPTLLPAGTKFSQVHIARYDPSAGAWALQPSFPSGAAVSAQINHFSLFAPFLISPGEGFDDIKIFPIPWKPGSSDERFNALQLMLSNLPPAAAVSVFSLAGERLWQGSAGADGVLMWRGDNRYGRPVGSGTYLLLIESGGRSTARRAVIVR